MITQSIARDAETVVNDVPLSRECNGFWVGVGGDVNLTLVGGKTITFTNVSAGFFGIHALQVNAMGTTATDIVALFI